MSENYSVDQIKEFILAKLTAENSRFIPHHDCGMCGEWVGWRLDEDNEPWFFSECGCSCGNGPRQDNWAYVADFYYMQSQPKGREYVAKLFGMPVESEAQNG